MSNRTATLAADTCGFGPDGRGLTLPAGTYTVYDADGVPDAVLYLLDPADPKRIVGCVQVSDVTIGEATHD